MQSIEIMYFNGTLLSRVRLFTSPPSVSSIDGVTVVIQDGMLRVTLQERHAIAGTFIASSVIETTCSMLYILGVPSKPTIEGDLNLSEGSAAFLNCSCTSTTTPNNHSLSMSSNWIINNTPISSDSSYSVIGKQLRVNNVSREDASKSFRCSCTEEVPKGYTSALSEPIYLDIQYGPDSAMLNPTRTSYPVEELAWLDDIVCSSDCNPACLFQWTKSGQITLVSNISTLSPGVIFKEYAGQYVCTAWNRKITKSANVTLTIIVLYGPYQTSTVLTPNTSEYVINENSALQDITCHADCYPPCTYQWAKEYDGRYEVVSMGAVLSLGTVNRSAAANYICNAKNPERPNAISTHAMFYLTVNYGPDTLCNNVSSDLVFTEGENITISCLSVCYPSCSYLWSNGIITVLSSELHLGIVQRHQAGSYTLTARNTVLEYKKEITKTFRITVRYAPLVRALFSTENHTEGSSVTLICKGYGVPENYTYINLTHTVGQAEIPNTNGPLDGTATYSSIHFRSLQLQDTGNYTCQMNNGIQSLSGTLDQSATAELLVMVKPKILRINKNLYGAEGGSVTPRVLFYCYPAAQSVNLYSYDGLLLTNDQKYKLTIAKKVVYSAFYGAKVSLNGYEVVLTITDLKKEDFTNFTISIQNIQGMTTVEVFVIAERKPSVPRRFDYNTGSTGLMFVWEKGFNGGQKQTFLLQVSVAGLNEWKNRISIEEDDEFYNINETFYKAEILNLKSGTYMASLVARNSVGESGSLQLNFTINGEKGNKEDTSHVIGGFAAAVAVLSIIVAILVVVICRKEFVTKGCRKTQTPESLKYSDLKRTEVEAETCTYEGLQSGHIENSDMTYDSLQTEKKDTETQLYSSSEKECSQTYVNTRIPQQRP